MLRCAIPGRSGKHMRPDRRSATNDRTRTMTDFQQGIVAMARNTLPIVGLLRTKQWTLEDFEKWLNEVIAGDEGNSPSEATSGGEKPLTI